LLVGQRQKTSSGSRCGSLWLVCQRVVGISVVYLSGMVVADVSGVGAEIESVQSRC
jgi:hypothetical protein